MTIAGKLSTMGFSEVLIWLSSAKKTGTLIVGDGQVEKRIYVRDGIIVSSSSSDPREYLGHFLVSHGLLTEEYLELALTRQERASDLLGSILVDLNLILEPDLERMLQHKAEETILDIFTWADGDFQFTKGALPEHEVVHISLGVSGLIRDGAKRAADWGSIQERIPSTECVPVAVTNLLKEGESLDEGRKKILAAVDGERTVEDIGFETHASDYFVGRTLLEAIERGAINIVRPAAALPTAAEPDRSPEDLLVDAEQSIVDADFRGAFRLLRAARRLAPADADVVAAIADLERSIVESLQGKGLHGDAVPKVVGDVGSLDGAELSPREAFVLSRVNGVYTVGGILKITPLPPMETLFVLWQLLGTGLIALQTGGEPTPLGI